MKYLFILILALSGLAHAETTYPVLVTHASGQTRLEQRPIRIVAVGTLALDVLIALGFEPVGYAATAPLVGAVAGQAVLIPFFAAKLKTKPVYIGDFRTPSLEALLALKPDLIIAPKFTSELYKNYSQIAPTLEFDFFTTPWKTFAPVIAKALGREERALEVIRAFERQTLVARSRVATLLAKYGRRVSVLFQNSQSTFLVSPFNALASFMQFVGLNAVLPSGFKSGARGIDPVSLEVLPSLRSDWCVIFTPNPLAVTELRRLLGGAGRLLVIATDPDRPSVGPNSEIAALNDLVKAMLPNNL